MYATTSPTALRATTFISSFFPAQSVFPHVNSVILRDILISYNTYPTGRIRMLPRIQLQDLIRMYHTQLHPVFLTNPEVISRDNIPLFQQGLMMQQLNSEKLVVEACIEGSYEKALQAFTLNKTVPSMTVAKEVLDDMIEANKEFWPELK